MQACFALSLNTFALKSERFIYPRVVNKTGEIMSVDTNASRDRRSGLNVRDRLNSLDADYARIKRELELVDSALLDSSDGSVTGPGYRAADARLEARLSGTLTRFREEVLNPQTGEVAKARKAATDYTDTKVGGIVGEVDRKANDRLAELRREGDTAKNEILKEGRALRGEFDTLKAASIEFAQGIERDLGAYKTETDLAINKRLEDSAASEDKKRRGVESQVEALRAENAELKRRLDDFFGGLDSYRPSQSPSA